MPQGYSPTFARVYNLLWAGFARETAPHLYDFYAASPQHGQPVLDLCCGTGQLAAYFLERGCRVVGLDLSESMLEHARANNQAYIEAGQARFVQGDAANFTLDERFGLCVSTYDALNHLPDVDALRSCFACVRAVMQPGGQFIFDLNTRLGLRRWNNLGTMDTDSAFIMIRGIYDGDDRGYTSITGFVREDDGRYVRFDEVAYNTVFDLDQVRDLLLETGWRDVRFARLSDLHTAVEAPEREGRIFIVAAAS
jgi:SAM-dependent methyltransferase